MSDVEHTASESNSKLVVSAVASIGFLLLFALIIWLTYIPTRSTDVNVAQRTERETKLAETKAAAIDLLENYSIVTPTAGVCRIPIEQAMELTVAKYRN